MLQTWELDFEMSGKQTAENVTPVFYTISGKKHVHNTLQDANNVNTKNCL